MRQIKFRGLTVETKRWVYGDLWRAYGSDTSWVIRDGHGNMGDYEVTPESVGQFTGLLDKNKKKIFEGDIFHLGDPKILYVTDFGEGYFGGMQNGNKSRVGLAYWNDKIETIGNIYENPSLLTSPQ